LLKDFPVYEWFEAADGCEFCGAPYRVMVTDLDESGCFGSVEWELEHKTDCTEVFDEGSEEEYGGVDHGEDVVGWEFMPEPFTFHGKQYYPLKSRANVGPCVSCGKLIIGVPLILFIDKGRKGELDFCPECVKRLGIMEMIRK
jgi:hypothetical protein